MTAGLLLLLLAACGTRSDGRHGAAGTSGQGPPADGGPTSCTSAGNVIASAGTGSLCGLKPVLGPPRTIVVLLDARNPDGGVPSSELCSFVGASDGAGDVLLQSRLLTSGGPSYDGLYSFDSSGAPLGQAVVGGSEISFAFPVGRGWIVRGGAENFVLQEYPPALQAPSLAFDGGFPWGVTFIWPPGGGAAAVAATGPLGSDPSCQSPPGWRLFATSLDGSGDAGFRDVPLGCFPGPGGISVGRNAAGEVLVVAGTEVAWHVTRGGIVSEVPHSPVGSLHPLIDGRFANRGVQGWISTLDVNGDASPPPCWLAQRPDVVSFQIVLEGRAYLAYHVLDFPPQPQPCDRYAELVLADGTSCGFIPLSGTEACSNQTVSVGLDGTLTTLHLGSCTASFWPGAFR